jgi:hypothetical protein
MCLGGQNDKNLAIFEKKINQLADYYRNFLNVAPTSCEHLACIFISLALFYRIFSDFLMDKTTRFQVDKTTRFQVDKTTKICLSSYTFDSTFKF